MDIDQNGKGFVEKVIVARLAKRRDVRVVVLAIAISLLTIYLSSTVAKNRAPDRQTKISGKNDVIATQADTESGIVYSMGSTIKFGEIAAGESRTALVEVDQLTDPPINRNDCNIYTSCECVRARLILGGEADSELCQIEVTAVNSVDNEREALLEVNVEIGGSSSRYNVCVVRFRLMKR